MERYSGQKKTASDAGSSESAKTTRSAVSQADMPSLSSKILVVSLIFAAIAVTGTIFTSAYRSITTEDPVKDGQYQAVFLDNGQVYFGKLSGARGDYVKLSDIYYLQVQQTIQPDGQATAADQQQISLAKLGNELHGPEDEMYISNSKITFWENLKVDGQVTEAIVRFQAGDQAPVTPPATGTGTTAPATGAETITPPPAATPTTPPATPPAAN